MGETSARLAVVVEDDADVQHLLRTILVRSGFEVILTGNGADGVEAVRLHDPDLTTLDVNMPGMDGLSAARAIREFSTTYIIMLTGLGEEVDVVEGLDSGADDYLVKPFRPRELRARIESVMRRPRRMAGDDVDVRSLQAESLDQRHLVSGVAAAGEHAVSLAGAHHPPQRSIGASEPRSSGRVGLAPQPFGVAGLAPAQGSDAWLGSNGLAVNVDTRTVVVDGRSVDLTRTEFDLVASLLATGRRVRSKADLVLTLRGQNYVTTYFVNEADKRAIEVHMANIRRKLGDPSTTPRWIETVRGVGYRMAGGA